MLKEGLMRLGDRLDASMGAWGKGWEASILVARVLS